VPWDKLFPQTLSATLPFWYLRSIVHSMTELETYVANLQSREALVKTAQLAEKVERWEDMCLAVRSLARRAKNDRQELSVEERNLFSVAYKMRLGALRSSWRTLASLRAQHELESQQHQTPNPELNAYIHLLENQLESSCREVLQLLEQELIDQTGSIEAQTFFYKMMADYYRYLAEFKQGQDREDASAFALRAYKEAQVRAENLKSTHPIRLGLALNLSVFYFEILSEHEKARVLAKTAHDAASANLAKTTPEEQKDASLILQLIDDNLRLWDDAEQNAMTD